MSSTLGKRKEREEESSLHHGSTLFVSNLPFTATSVDLQTLFSDIAPVRSAFVVTEQGTGVSKGVGYVSFALKEDAESALETLSKDGISLVGRKLRVQWADAKPKEKMEKPAAVKKEAKPRPHHHQQKLPHDPLAIKTIVISGLPTGIDEKILWKKIRKYAGAEKLDWPLKIENELDDPLIAHVLFSTPAQANDAVNKLHAHVYKGSLLSVTLKKRLEALSRPVATAKQTLKSDPEGTVAQGKVQDGSAAPTHASRLIVRNIPFNATEQDLRAIFLPYGPIYSIHIPTEDKPTLAVADSSNQIVDDAVEQAKAEAYSSVKRRPPRTKGFAFVWMLSKKDAERAMEKCNGMVVRAGTAQALVEDKQKKKRLRRLEKKARAASGGSDAKKREDEEGYDEEDDDKNEEDTERAAVRVIAVDWALSKNKWEEEKAKNVSEDVQMDDTSEGAEENENDDGDEDSDDQLGVHNENDEDDEDDTDSQPNEDGEDDDEKPIKPQLPPPETGTTLFIRNIPFNSTEEELRTLFRSFGPLRYTRITIDPSTGRSRGTGFACFWNLEDADRVVTQSELLKSETTGHLASVIPKKNPFTLPSILTPDPSSSLAQSLVLHGRTLDVVRAVTRDAAGKLKENNERMREKSDKRNMYLIREGVIMPNTPESDSLTPTEIDRRTKAFNARRALLKSNPSLFISKTRLSVRQIPPFVTERMLRRLAGHAIRQFEVEVEKGERPGLLPHELASTLESQREGEQGESSVKKKSKIKKGKSTPLSNIIKQTKIVRQAERVDALTGKGRSRGYGFIELHQHQDALRALRWSNNNPAALELFDGWWKEELETILKAERAKDEKDDLRIKKLKEEISREADGVGKKKAGKGTLIVEFSIENVQVLQRRNMNQKSKTQEKPTSDAVSPKNKRQVIDGEDKQSEEPSPKKRRRLSSESKPAKSQLKSPSSDKVVPKSKDSHPLGSLIGRKRKERKTGKKSRN